MVDEDLHVELFENIVLNGGSTMFPGIAKRLKKEIQRLLWRHSYETVKVEIIALEERSNAAWNGGSIMASLPSFQDMWITNEEFEEFGPTIVHRKCYN